MTRKVMASPGSKSVVLPGGWVLDAGDQVVIDDAQWAIITANTSLVVMLTDLGEVTDPITQVPSYRDIQRFVYPQNLGLRSTTSTQPVPTSAWTQVLFTATADHDSGTFAVASSVATIPVAGLYSLGVSLMWGSGTSGRRACLVESFTTEALGAGTLLGQHEITGVSGGAFISALISTDVLLAAGTTIRAVVWQNSGADTTIAANSVPAQFNIRRVG